MNRAIGALAAEFTGWSLRVEDELCGEGPIWSASRYVPPARGGCLRAEADGPQLLKEILDARIALRDLAAELRRRGVPATAYGTTLAATGPRMRIWAVTCGRGAFRWPGDGRPIAPIEDVADAAAQVMRALRPGR